MKKTVMSMKRMIALLLCAVLLLPACGALAERIGEYAVDLTHDLAMDSTGDAVMALQGRLAVLGFLAKEPDGVFDKATKDAVGMLETCLNTRDAGKTHYAVDGTADTVVLNELYMIRDGLTQKSVRYGDSGITVKRVQNRLKNLGYLSAAESGKFDSYTRTAMRAFQYSEGLPETGVADEKTQERLFAQDALRSCYKASSAGDSGDHVRDLQLLLIRLGFLQDTVDGADGVYGGGTKKAVTLAQKYLESRGVQLGGYSAPEKEKTEPAAATPSEPAQPKGYTLRIGAGEVCISTGEDPYGVNPNGAADPMLLEYLYNVDMTAGVAPIGLNDSGDDVKRVQRRLYSLEYLFNNPDGIFGKETSAAIRKFQEFGGLPQTGLCDEETLRLLFSEDAPRYLRKYILKISVAKQRVYAYTYDENYEYTILERTMKCSTGTKANPTPTGTFKNTGPAGRWHHFEKWDSWAQYAYYVYGDIMIHSVLYRSNDTSTLVGSSVSALGRRASHGCIRLSVEDARWVWQNCEAHTTVIIY